MDNGFSKEALFRFYRLYSEKITRPMMSAYRDEFTQVEHLVLAIMAGEESIAMGDLVERIRMPKQQVSRAVNDLEAAGMVEKVRDQTDKRCILLHLTDRAKKSMDDFSSSAAEYAISALDSLGGEARQEFFVCLARMGDILEKL